MQITIDGDAMANVLVVLEEILSCILISWVSDGWCLGVVDLHPEASA